MLMRGLANLRDVIAFPKTNRAVSPMDECPSEVERELLEDLHIEVRGEVSERP
jgi:aspartyl-tRNA synthetase